MKDSNLTKNVIYTSLLSFFISKIDVTYNFISNIVINNFNSIVKTIIEMTLITLVSLLAAKLINGQTS